MVCVRMPAHAKLPLYAFSVICTVLRQVCCTCEHPMRAHASHRPSKGVAGRPACVRPCLRVFSVSSVLRVSSGPTYWGAAGHDDKLEHGVTRHGDVGKAEVEEREVAAGAVAGQHARRRRGAGPHRATEAQVGACSARRRLCGGDARAHRAPSKRIERGNLGGARCPHRAQPPTYAPPGDPVSGRSSARSASRCTADSRTHQCTIRACRRRRSRGCIRRTSRRQSRSPWGRTIPRTLWEPGSITRRGASSQDSPRAPPLACRCPTYAGSRCRPIR